MLSGLPITFPAKMVSPIKRFCVGPNTMNSYCSSHLIGWRWFATMFVNIYPMCIVLIHSNRFDLPIDEVNPLFLSRVIQLRSLVLS